MNIASQTPVIAVTPIAFNVAFIPKTVYNSFERIQRAHGTEVYKVCKIIVELWSKPFRKEETHKAHISTGTYFILRFCVSIFVANDKSMAECTENDICRCDEHSTTLFDNKLLHLGNCRCHLLIFGRVIENSERKRWNVAVMKVRWQMAIRYWTPKKMNGKYISATLWWKSIWYVR